MRILCYILVVLFVTTTAVGQQINPVPDYIFRNSMSVGRNAPTDTSAYFSIGPRFGATRGFMPPMVVDTAAVTGTKRNGLLIYSIQRNSYLYWDSTGNRWSRLASLSDTITLSTRAWRQKGIDSVASVRIGGSGVTGYIPKFTAARTLDSSQIFQSGWAIGVGTTTPESPFKFDINGGLKVNGQTILAMSAITDKVGIGTSTPGGSTNSSAKVLEIFSNTVATNPSEIRVRSNGSDIAIATGESVSYIFERTNRPMTLWTNSLERMRIQANGRIGVNTSVDAGYQFDVTGSMRNTTDAYFATSSGRVSVGHASPNVLFDVRGNGFVAKFTSINGNSNQIAFSNASDGTAHSFMGSSGSNTWQLSNASGTPKLSMVSSGNVSVSDFLGIGTTGPTTPLAISNGATMSAAGLGDMIQIRRSQSNGNDSGRVAIHFANSSNGFKLVYGGTTDRFRFIDGGNTELMTILNNVGVGINTIAPSEALHVTGRARVTTIDSSASPINMLWATPTGVISKTAPPAFMVSSNATAAASWNFARDVTNSGNISRVTRTHDNAGDTTVTFHIAVYIATASFTTGSWVEVATLPTGYRPNEVVYGSLPDFVSGDVYEAQNGTDFAADAEYTGATVFRVLKDGKVQVRVATVTSSVTLSGTNNVLFPISFTFTVRPISV